LIKVFRDRAPGGKPRQQLFDIACCHDEPMLAVWLARNAGLDAARQFDKQRSAQGRKSYAAYFSKNSRCFVPMRQPRMSIVCDEPNAADGGGRAGNVDLVARLADGRAVAEDLDQQLVVFA